MSTSTMNSFPGMKLKAILSKYCKAMKLDESRTTFSKNGISLDAEKTVSEVKCSVHMMCSWVLSMEINFKLFESKQC